MTLDYTTSEKVTLTIKTEAEFSVWSKTLTLSGELAHSPLNHAWTGAGAITLEVSKNVALELSQEIAAKGGKTALKIQAKF